MKKFPLDYAYIFKQKKKSSIRLSKHNQVDYFLYIVSISWLHNLYKLQNIKQEYHYIWLSSVEMAPIYA